MLKCRTRADCEQHYGAFATWGNEEIIGIGAPVLRPSGGRANGQNPPLCSVLKSVLRTAVLATLECGRRHPAPSTPFMQFHGLQYFSGVEMNIDEAQGTALRVDPKVVVCR
jgi:hypothetical protein